MQAISPSTAPRASAAAEAARYALLRRLAPSMRHHLVVNLQPISMISEVLERRLRAPAPDMHHVKDSAHKISGFTRAALDSCQDVVGWLAPDESVGTTAEQAAAACSALLATSLGFRGYTLRNEVPSVPGTLRRSAARTLLTAGLVHVTDHVPAPADLVLGARPYEGRVQVALAVRRRSGEAGTPAQRNYRDLTWEDLEALAHAEGAGLRREGDGLVLDFETMAAG